MENSYRFFENKDCKYFPCHKGLTEFQLPVLLLPHVPHGALPRESQVFREERQTDQGLLGLHLPA